MSKNEMVIINITFSMARNSENPEENRNFQGLRQLSRTTRGFHSVKNRTIWKPGLAVGPVKKYSLKRASTEETTESGGKSSKVRKELSKWKVEYRGNVNNNDKARAHSNNAMPSKKRTQQNYLLPCLG